MVGMPAARSRMSDLTTLPRTPVAQRCGDRGASQSAAQMARRFAGRHPADPGRCSRCRRCGTAVLRACLVWQASRCGYQLNIARVSGGPFGPTCLEDVRLRQRGDGTDLQLARAQFTVAWKFPWPGPLRAHACEKSAWKGCAGRLDLDATAGGSGLSETASAVLAGPILFSRRTTWFCIEAAMICG